MADAQRVQTLIIGAGQAGLSVGYHLARRGSPFVILESHARVGNAWRQRWDSLRLFTPARFDGLVGMPFPAAANAFPTKDEMANYLESYAARFRLPVRTGVTVDGVTRCGDEYLVTAGRERFQAEQVVVAMAGYQRPRVPPYASDLDSRIVQLHSSAYRNPSQLRAGGVLVVGAGNSGAEIAKETAHGPHGTWLSGRDTGHIPFRHGSRLARTVLTPFVLRVVFHRMLTTDTPMGRKARPQILAHGGPLVRTRSVDLAAAGVERVGRVTGTRDGLPMLEDGRVLAVANVIWCTGYADDLSWIDAPVFAADGTPLHERGITNAPGLYFVGRTFLYAMSSSMIHGVGRDAGYVADAIRARADASSRRRAVGVAS